MNPRIYSSQERLLEKIKTTTTTPRMPVTTNGNNESGFSP